MTNPLTINGLEVSTVDAFEVEDNELYVAGQMNDGQLLHISIDLKELIKLAADNGLAYIYPLDEDDDDVEVFTD